MVYSKSYVTYWDSYWHATKTTTKNHKWSHTWIWQPADNPAIRHLVCYIMNWKLTRHYDKPTIQQNSVILYIEPYATLSNIYQHLTYTKGKYYMMWWMDMPTIQHGLLCYKSKVPPVFWQTGNTVKWPNMMRYCWVCSKQLLSYEFGGSIFTMVSWSEIMKAFFEPFM